MTKFRFLAPMPRITNGLGAWSDELRRIEDLGFYAVVVSEHYGRSWAMDALAAMNFALARTTRLRAMPLVLNNDLHHPGTLAKTIATADVLSAGRAGLGLGAGWLRDDYEALGANYDTASTRIARLEEALQVIASFFSDQSVTFVGHHYQINNLAALPRPVQLPRPAILVGAGGPKILDLAARYADIVGLHARLGTSGFDRTTAEQLTRSCINDKLALVAAAAEKVGRIQPDIQFTCYDVEIFGAPATTVRPSFSEYISSHADDFDDSPVSLRGDVSKCVDDLLRWQEDLGISYWNLGSNLSAIAPIVARLSAE